MLEENEHRISIASRQGTQNPIPIKQGENKRNKACGRDEATNG